MLFPYSNDVESYADHSQNIRQIKTENEQVEPEVEMEVEMEVELEVEPKVEPEVEDDAESKLSEEFSCDMCDKEFGEISLLESHIMNDHLKNTSSSVISTEPEVVPKVKPEVEPEVDSEVDSEVESEVEMEIEPDQEVENDIKQESEPKSIRPKVVLKKQSESKITYLHYF